MRKWKNLTTLEEIELFIKTNPLSFLYLSRDNCSVCHALLPQVEQLMEKYPNIQIGHVRIEDVEEVAGRFSIFTVPVLLLFFEGKEYIREARIVHLNLLEKKLNKIYNNVEIKE